MVRRISKEELIAAATSGALATHGYLANTLRFGQSTCGMLVCPDPMVALTLPVKNMAGVSVLPAAAMRTVQNPAISLFTDVPTVF